MRRFYSENRIGDKEHFEITGQEANHILNVNRLTIGDELIVFDGSGYDFVCSIEDSSRGKAVLRVVSKEYNTSEPGVNITLYSASIKKDKLDYAFQKCCEIGIVSFRVFNALRSIRKVTDPDKLVSRLDRIAIETSKQCGRSRMPDVGFISDTKEVASRIREHDCVIFAYEEEDSVHISDVIPYDAADIGIIIGPEGGFDAEEADLLKNSGARVCSLGKLILRAETAAVFAVSSVMFARERP